MKEIQLTQGQVAKVCDCHAHLVEGHKWRAQWNKKTQSFYAVRVYAIAMHRVINQTPKGFETDHINHNTLDNQCSNLRTATPTQNHYNRRKHKTNKSGYTGVSWSKKSKTWDAQISINGRNKHIGSFRNPEDAARAYDAKAKELRGEFAVTNF